MSMGVPQAPNFSGGLMGILGGLLSGYQGGQKEKAEKKQTGIENQEDQQQFALDQQKTQLGMKVVQQQLSADQLTQQTAARAAATSQLQQLSSQLTQDPSRAKDPAFLAKYNALTAAAGQIPEYSKDGSIDVNALKPSFAQSTLATDPKAMTAFAQLPTATQKAMLDQMSGVPKELYNAKPFVTAKDQAALDRASAQNSHWHNQDKYQARVAEAHAKYYDEEGQLIPAKATEYYAGAALDRSRASAVVTTANATATRATAYATSVDNLQKRFEKSPNGSMGAVRSLLSTSTSQLRGLQSSFDSAERNLENARVNVTDPDELKEAEAAVTTAQAELKKAREADFALRSSVQDNPQVSAFVGASSGKPAVNVGSPSGGSKTLYSTSGGKPIISTDGGKTWNYS
jgi:hypothetical protein